jgi:sugar-specific transcriptional regulator TrmB
MGSIPPSLVEALCELGLSNFEARVYAALVLHDCAEVKEIIDYLGISKPSVYEALDRLAERGFAVKRITKPVVYSAVAPKKAIHILMDRHRQAANLSLESLEKLETERIRIEDNDALWTIYGESNIDYKIRDLFNTAKHNIRCSIGEHYLPVIEKCKTRDISLRLAVFSDIPGLKEKLKRTFPGKKTEIHVIPLEKIFAVVPRPLLESDDKNERIKPYNVLEILVDDEELIMIPPFFSGTASVINTRNKSAVYQTKVMGEMFWHWLIHGEDNSFLSIPMDKKPRRARKKKD